MAPRRSASNVVAAAIAKKKPAATKTTPTQKPASTKPDEAHSKAFHDRIGISPETLKAKLANTDNKSPAPTGKIKSFIDTLNSRIKDGRRQSLRDYRAWVAVDEACNAPFNQLTPTLIGKIMSKPNLTDTDIMKQLSSWGLSEDSLFAEITLKNGTKEKRINQQTFYKIFLPLVLAYTQIRWAKLYNDRDQFPLLLYSPYTATEDDTLKAEAITAVVEKMGHQMGARATLKAVILHALKYAMAFPMPMEAWYSEMQPDDKGGEYCVREGIRYHIPHPTRCAYDMVHRPSTFNTDTGCEWALYWRMMRFGDIANNPAYWNKDKVAFTKTNWFDANISGNYFTEIYPCTMPPLFDDGNARTSTREGVANIYTTGDHDKPAFLTDMFWKLKPSEWGLGDYKYNVWFRFVVASDDTIVYAEPIPYNPVLYLGLDCDENQARNASFALQVLPFQDHLGNILSQILISTKQNSTKIIPYDEDQINEDNIRDMKAQGRDVNTVVFLPFSGRESRMAQQDKGSMFLPVQLPMQDTNSQTQTMNTVINIMERLLGMSSAEVGAAGAHVQTAEEIRVISTNTSSRVDFTGTHVDDFLDGWKRQQYIAAMEYMDEEFIVEVSGNEEYAAALKSIGFAKVGASTNPGKIIVKGKKSMLTMEAFASVREGKNRVNNPQIAQVLLQTIQIVAANERLAQAVGTDQIINWVNKATRMAGGSREDKLSNTGDAEQMQLMQEMQAQIEKSAQQIASMAVQESGEQMKPVVEEVQAQGQEIENTATAVAQTNQAVKQQGEDMKQIAAVLKQLQTMLASAVQAQGRMSM